MISNKQKIDSRPVFLSHTRGSDFYRVWASVVFMEKELLKVPSVMCVILSLGLVVLSQNSTGALSGVVRDQLGAAIVGATVVLTDAGEHEKTTATNSAGVFSFTGLAPGRYTLRASAQGFAEATSVPLEIGGGERAAFDFTLKVTIEEQRVTVGADAPISIEANKNANQTVITGKDLDALPDDPDDLAAALRAIAGPQAGPEGGQIFVDGFSGTRLPAKDSIREIRINQNPFAAENDQPAARIDILTKPGTEKLRGGLFLNFNDESLNARNPLATNRPPYQLRQYGGNLSGPVNKGKASFYFDLERREQDDNQLVKARILDSSFRPVAVSEGVVVPTRFLSFSPRFDYALNERNTLVLRYSYFHSSGKNNGVAGFSLPERAYESAVYSHTLQLTETAVLNAATINETRFQFTYNRSESVGTLAPVAVNVTGAFVGGSSQVGHFQRIEKRWELQNFTSHQRNQHALKIGGRLRGVNIDDVDPRNFGGTYSFTGGFVPRLDVNGLPVPGADPVAIDSLERYRRTMVFQSQGKTPTEIRELGGGAAQFNISSGNPAASVSQIDLAIYAQDDWRMRPNLTLSYGLRYEHQTNIHSNLNFAPRLMMAWAPGAADSARPPKMVIRVGGGVFYARFGEAQTLLVNRFNGENTLQFTLKEDSLYACVKFPNANPSAPCVLNQNGQLMLQDLSHSAADNALNAFSCAANPCPPLLNSLTSSRLVQWRRPNDLRTPTFYMAGVLVERQLPHKVTAFAGLFLLRLVHATRALDLNAPLPNSSTNFNPSGVRPLGNVGDVYQFDSGARLNQRIYLAGFNSRFNPRVSLFFNYSLSYGMSDADGPSFSANPYDFHSEYGRSGIVIRHGMNTGGTISLPWWQLTLNPLVFASSGAPFNIITGADTNLDGQFTERPSFAPAGIPCAGPGKPANIICTRFGKFNLQPAPGETLIPRNYGNSPGYFSINLGISKVWMFGRIGSGTGPAARPKDGAARQAKKAGPGLPTISSTAGTSEPKRYSMQFTINFQNLFNHSNLQPPGGNLSSPCFWRSLGLSGSGCRLFGGGGSGSFGAGNRRISFRVRFNF